MEDETIAGLGAEFELVSRRMDEKWNIDPRQRVRALDNKQGAWRQLPQGLAGAQCRKRALQAFEVERLHRPNISHVSGLSLNLGEISG
jgi:hypothetical protein